MKIIGMTCVMAMHIIVPLKKIVKYFGGITIDDLKIIHFFINTQWIFMFNVTI